MKQTMDIIEQISKNIQSMLRKATYMCLVEKSLSEETSDKLLEPMRKMNWEEKDKYATELNTILETSKTEEEMLHRAEEVLKNI